MNVMQDRGVPPLRLPVNTVQNGLIEKSSASRAFHTSPAVSRTYRSFHSVGSLTEVYDPGARISTEQIQRARTALRRP